MKIVKWQEIPDLPGKAGFSAKKLIDYPDATVTIISLNKTEVVKKHITPVDALFYVVEGSGEVQIEDEIQEVHQGDLIYSPKKIPHELRNPKSDMFRFLVIKTPNPASLQK